MVSLLIKLVSLFSSNTFSNSNNINRLQVANVLSGNSGISLQLNISFAKGVHSNGSRPFLSTLMLSPDISILIVPQCSLLIFLFPKSAYMLANFPYNSAGLNRFFARSCKLTCDTFLYRLVKPRKYSIIRNKVLLPLAPEPKNRNALSYLFVL